MTDPHLNSDHLIIDPCAFCKTLACDEALSARVCDCACHPYRKPADPNVILPNNIPFMRSGEAHGFRPGWPNRWQPPQTAASDDNHADEIA